MSIKAHIVHLVLNIWLLGVTKTASMVEEDLRPIVATYTDHILLPKTIYVFLVHKSVEANTDLSIP